MDYLWRPMFKSPERVQGAYRCTHSTHTHTHTHTPTHTHTHLHAHTHTHSYTHTHTHTFPPSPPIGTDCVCIRAHRAGSSAKPVRTVLSLSDSTGGSLSCPTKRVVGAGVGTRGLETWAYFTGGGDRDRQTDRQNSNSNSKTLFYKDCSLGSFKNLSNN